MANALRPVRGKSNSFVIVLQNGPQFAAALNALDLKLSRVVARIAVQRGAQVIADEWKALVPVEDGHYRESIRVTTRSATLATGDGGRAIKGASAVIAPRPVGGVPDDEQPWRYAGVLEFGGRLTPAQHGSYIPAQPSARPAFENKARDCVDVVQATLAAMLP